MTAFAAAASVMFRDRNMTEEIQWWRRGGIKPQAMRAIVSAPDDTTDFNGVRLSTATFVAEVLVSDMDRPEQGQLVQTRGAVYRILGNPMLDAHGTTWRIDLVPK